MKLNVAKLVRKGATVVYNDGRSGHRDVKALVLAVDSNGMTVQFDDRADTTRIQFADPKWMDFISIAG